ncbi:MAG: hypothetical protein HQK51_07745, partial [Oligoflexia bacterium]|nr:hypothetical protein [Oligoflexia bacterium]
QEANSPLEIRGNLAMGFDQHQQMLKFKIDRFNFNTIKRGQFVVNGPHSCHGLFGIPSRLQSLIVNQLLTQIRPLLNWTLGHQLRLISSVAEKIINSASNFTIPISFPEFKIIPATTVSLSAYPNDFAVSAKSLKLKLSVLLAKNYDGFVYYKNNNKNLRPEERIVLGERIGTVAIRPTLLNELLQAFLKKGSLPFEVTKEMNADLGAMLSRQELAVFWPDLDSVNADSNEMRLDVKITKVPTIDNSWKEETVSMNVPQLLVTFKILQNGKWKNYFNLLLDLKATIKPNVNEGKIMLKLLSTESSISGKWAQGYTPKNDQFNQEDFKRLLDTIVNMMAANSEPMAFKAPILPMGNYHLTIDNLKLVQPFISFDLTEVLK